MLAGLRAGLGAGCAVHGQRGQRLAHSRTTEKLQREYDAVVIGAGHNGLVAAAYLQQAGLRTAVLEKRHVLGGAAVTEEIVPGTPRALHPPAHYLPCARLTTPCSPGFKFSRASYLLSLLRPQIYAELELQRHGLKVLPRDPYSFTPLLEDRSPPRSLLMGHNMAQTQQQIAQFSQKDAQAVCRVLLGTDGQAQGVVMQDGTEVRSKVVLSNASPQLTFLELTPQVWGHHSTWHRVTPQLGHPITAVPSPSQEQLPEDFVRRIQQLDTRSPVTKINVAVDRLPSFLAAPNTHDNQPLPHHCCSIHLNCEGTHLLHQAYTEAAQGHPSSRPMIELCIPSVLDPGLAPPGCHVVSLFTQYTPYELAGGQPWDEKARNAYADTVFDCIEAYAPGFKASVIGRDILTPPDLERIFGLPGGNIFHGGMSLDQLYFTRPAPSYSTYQSPVPGLYLCGSGAHPGGGVMGAAGRNAAQVVLRDFRRLRWQR
ncbi:pyridine nucleotide-disulfide oxidoreductase domain-containing protein 2 isoform X8 [Meleagris gallopavo]|uniref:pyridine nucleotide-disulfide oxidoreductase domain-containing protein 2 isoform X8 n=1 Tax=Meleagris gallopavo TaxID=9103 RepID=UPI000938947F|nr:pyridine nucleotide-disulfide oxidoreductase domain-containing protein 2 isoform X8 [Meleagris gallopavo]